MRTMHCSWVPGTLNRVRLKDPHSLIELNFDRAEEVLGRGALHDLYLKGRVTLNVNDDTLRRLKIRVAVS